MLAQRAVDGKSNEITAIPELLDMLNLKGAIVSIDAMGTQKEIAQRIIDKGADYVLALKGSQASLHEDAALFFADPVCAAACARIAETDAGHGRIEERSCRVAEASWLAERHPDWKGLRSLAAVTARRVDKKTGGESLETRFYVTSLEPDPKAILASVRAHWGIENNLHWTMDVTFDEDRFRTRKDASPLNFAIFRHAGYNLLKADKTRCSLRRKRLRRRWSTSCTARTSARCRSSWIKSSFSGGPLFELHLNYARNSFVQEAKPDQTGFLPVRFGPAGPTGVDRQETASTHEARRLAQTQRRHPSRFRAPHRGLTRGGDGDLP